MCARETGRVPGMLACPSRSYQMNVWLLCSARLVHPTPWFETGVELRSHPCLGGVWQALVTLFKEQSDHLLAKLPEIMNFMLTKTQVPQTHSACCWFQ